MDICVFFVKKSESAMIATFCFLSFFSFIHFTFEQKCELRKRSGVAGMWDSVVTKLNSPFQPDVPDTDIHKDSQSRVYFKTLKHPFIRDKLHL